MSIIAFWRSVHSALYGIAGLCALLWAAPALAGGAPQRVVSANLCADQLLLALADPQQIASLSPFARDPALSYLAAGAAAFPANRGVGEDIIRLDADLVLTGPWDSRYTRELLSMKGMPTFIVGPWADFADGYVQIRDLAARLGHPERGEALVGRIEAALGQLDRQTRPPKATSLVLHRRGFVLHAGLTAAILERGGLTDASREVGVSGAGFARLESIIAARPDYLVVSQGSALAEDQGEAFLVHPGLARLYPRERRLIVPDRLTICEGPATPDLIATIGGEIAARVTAAPR